MELTTLPSGVRVATQRWAVNGETATSGIWVAAGSVCDAAEAPGAAHFLEHCVLKGSRRWPSRQALELHVEELGAQLHAFTSREQTCFLARSRRGDVAHCVELLADLALHPALRRADVDAERATILREMEEVSRQPEEVVYDHLHELAFPGTPLGRPILGSAASVARISRDDLLAHVRRWYTPDRIVVAAAGPVSHAQVVAAAERCFPTAEHQHQPLHKFQFQGGGVRWADMPATLLDTNPAARKESDSLCYCALASRAAPVSTAAEPFPWLVLQALVGGFQQQHQGERLSPISAHRTPLCKTLSGSGLCELVQPFFMPYSGDGLFGVYFAAKRSNVIRVLSEIRAEWRRLASPALNEAEVRRAAERACEQVLIGLDTTAAVCEDIGRQLLSRGKRITAADWSHGFRSVTARTIQRIAQNNLTGLAPVFAAIGTDMATAVDRGEIPIPSFFSSWA